MEYHDERFIDYSLLISNSRGQLIAVLPANIDGETVYSHQGLTFGGFLINEKMRTELMLQVFESLKTYLKSQEIKKLVYKPLPYIYHLKASDEDRYALFRNKASLVKQEVSSVIYLNELIRYSKGRKWAVNKAKKENLQIVQSTDFRSFWKVLSEVLEENHRAKPVHTANEMEELAASFPENIKLFCVKRDSIIVAGAVIFENPDIVHTQYMANSVSGRELGALDLLIDNLIKEVYSNKKYFDFGISNEDSGLTLNTGLISQKEGFGAHPIVQDMYTLEIE